MSKPNEDVIDVESQDVPQWAADLKDMVEEKALVRSIEADESTLISRLVVNPDQAQKALEVRAKLFGTLRKSAIRETNPQDWVLNRDREGNVLAMPKSAACAKIGEQYGINVYDIRPIDAGGAFRPEIDKNDDGSVVVKAWCSARSEVTGRDVPMIEAVRSSKEKFIGRDDFPSDLRNSVLTLLNSKSVRIIAAVSGLSLDQLNDAWEGIDYKNTDKCVKGHGFGSSGDRAASGVTAKDVKEDQIKLRDDLLRRCQGSQDDAKKLLMELTTFTNSKKEVVKGKESVSRITSEAQMKVVWVKLRKHPDYGDAAIKKMEAEAAK